MDCEIFHVAESLAVVRRQRPDDEADDGSLIDRSRRGLGGIDPDEETGRLDVPLERLVRPGAVEGGTLDPMDGKQVRALGVTDLEAVGGGRSRHARTYDPNAIELLGGGRGGSVRLTSAVAHRPGMWPLGHAAVAYCLYSTSTRVRFDRGPAALATLVVLVGSSFPDLVDKPFSWYLGVLPTGRSLAHSLLVLVPLCLCLWLIVRRGEHSELGIAAVVGLLSHSLVDAMPALWDDPEAATHLLWPVLGVEEYETGPPTILGLLLDSLGDPWFLLEFLLAAVALVLWRADGYPGPTAVRAGITRIVGRPDTPKTE